MLNIAPWRIIVVVLVLAIGALFAAPNVLPASVRNSMPGFLPSSGVNLGLDLRGGSYLRLQVDTEDLRQQLLENAADSMGQALADASPAIRFTGRGVVADAARVRVIDEADMDRAMEAMRPLVERIAGEPNLRFQRGENGLIEARVSDRAMRELSRQAALQSIEVIRRRIDPNGTSEVSIVPEGDDRIVVQAPGMTDPAQLRDRIGKTALMTFHLVNDDPSAIERVNETGRPPSGYMLAPPYPEVGRNMEIVRQRPYMTGEVLNSASVQTDAQTGEYALGMDFNGTGERVFCAITREHVGDRFAILLDDQVLTAPVIRGEICGTGSNNGQITGSFTAESASELALMLNAGALPAPLEVIEQRSVGAGLGADSIEAGIVAGVVGAVAVLVLMVLFYGGFGVMACVALVVNIILIIAAMSMIGAALTLPGIAGLILTIGMAVDANVLIYERMREEQANGRSAAQSIDSGFSRALVTIMDANITTILAALILFQFGAGPVQGFAWTLIIGCLTTVFTATIVTQMMVAYWFRLNRPKQLPI